MAISRSVSRRRRFGSSVAVLAVLAAVAAAVAGVVGLTPAASAATAFGAPTTLVSRCGGERTGDDQTYGGAAFASDGTLRGFAHCGSRIVYYRLPAGSSTTLVGTTPYSSDYNLDDIAWDGYRTLYALIDNGDGDGLFVIHHTEGQASWSAPVAITSHYARAGTQATIVARTGRWWAVWREAGGLYEARTLGAVQPRHRISAGALSGSHVANPSLAYEQRRVVLAATHGTDVVLAGRNGALWAPRRVAANADANSTVDVALHDRHIYLAWQGRSSHGATGKAWYADGVDAGHLSRVELGVPRSIVEPIHLSVTTGAVAVAYGLTTLHVAVRRDGTWSITNIAAGSDYLDTVTAAKGVFFLVTNDLQGSSGRVAVRQETA